MTTVVNRVHRRVTRWTKVHPCASVKLDSSASTLRCSIPLASVRESVAAAELLELTVALLFLSLAHPNEPENVTVDQLDQVSVRISWKQEEDTVYHLECHHSVPCESYITYQPNQTFIQASRFEQHRGDQIEKHRLCLVFAFSVSIRRRLIKSKSMLNKSQRDFWANLCISPSPRNEPVSRSIDRSYSPKGHSQWTVFYSVSKLIGDIQFRRLSFETVLITWSSDDFDQYQLRYWSLIDSTKKMLVILNSNNFTLVTTTESYRFQIRGHTEQGWTVYTKEQLISLRSMLIEENRTKDARHRLVENKTVLLMGPVVILGLIVLVILLALIYSKK